MKRYIWNRLSEDEQEKVIARPSSSSNPVLEVTVSSIIKRIKSNGDSVLKAMTQKYDNVKLEDLQVDQTLIDSAEQRISTELKQAIDDAAANINTFHQAQKTSPIKGEIRSGLYCELKTEPINSVGLYVPSGSAPLISTVLMLGIPAQIAGCHQTILVTPPPINDAILYAAQICGIDQIYLSGGAQAIAALAYGTQSIPKVDKIFGPGNSYVTEAKRQVSLDTQAKVSIDMPAGPSEVLIIADNSAKPHFITADLLSQAEHGPDSQVILLTNDANIADKVEDEIAKQLAELPRKDIAEKSLALSSIVLVEDIEQAIFISNKYAPEHLIIQTQDPESLLPKLRAAGSVFLGHYTPEAIGDYASGTNHVLPTYGYASSISSLSLADFYRRFTIQKASYEGLNSIGCTVTTLAEAEQLVGHKNAVTVRLKEPQPSNSPPKSVITIHSQPVKPDPTNNTSVELASIELGNQLARTELLTLEPYQSARRIGGQGDIWINANESPFNNHSFENDSKINRYPDCQPAKLIEAYSQYANVDADKIVATRGADEAIELLIRTFCIPGKDSITVFDPSYGMYEISAASCNIKVNKLPLHEHTLLAAADTSKTKIHQDKLIFLCNPNNPTGNLVLPQEIEFLLLRFPDKLVVVDEAYIEFSPEYTAAGLINQYPNLVILRTLSKAFALAGIRCGFLLANTGICKLIMRVIAPYPIPVPVADIAVKALSPEGVSLMQSQVADLKSCGQQLTQVLTQVGAYVQPSHGNFVLARFDNVKAVQRQLAQAGIVTRSYSHPYLNNAIRFSFTDQAETEQLISVLQTQINNGYQQSVQ